MARPNRFLTLLACGSMLSSTLLAAPAAAQRVEVGNAATVVGEVRLSNDQIRNPQEIQRRQRLAWGDQIDTGRRSQLQILLLDRSTFGIGARSSMRIDRFVYDPEEGRSMFVTFIKGALRYFSGRQEGENTADIQTPSGRIGIRGTALDVLVGKDAENIAEDEQFVGNVRSNDDEATLVVLRGPGAQTAGELTVGLVEVEAAGVTVVLDQPGLAAYIPRNGAPPIGPFRISDAGLAKVQDEISPSVARAADGGGLLDTLLPVAVGAIAVGVLVATTGGGDDDRPPTQGSGQTPDTAGQPGANDYPDYPPNTAGTSPNSTSDTGGSNNQID
ncbi:hypothetical protein GCM10009127_13270 [Alteraurantiacibacter aestuarii]|uniref:FecR protein domain-containing protein n=1 Tax=Alteraurantiacibacter aestuarii TaxID=650004 RepID=A0A844ZKM0_9SPHN|nr:FecR domain-containing protein [Alteraurantiacibacter aestuarii]MXO88083.1 hypothetical protein [Alteraurantiacibacter aestuarii]